MLTSETPFKLTYKAEAIISLEISLVFDHVKKFDEFANQGKLYADLDFKKFGRKLILGW